MPNKIVSSLSADQLNAFNERCRTTRGLTLEKIAELADEMGIEISLMSVRTYKNTTFQAYLDELKYESQEAESIATVAKLGLGLSDAAAVGLSRKIYARSKEKKLEDGELDQLSLALSRLRLGDQRSQLLDKRVKEYERKEIQWDEARAKAREIIGKLEKKAGLSKEARAEIEKVLGGEAA